MISSAPGWLWRLCPPPGATVTKGGFQVCEATPCDVTASVNEGLELLAEKGPLKGKAKVLELVKDVHAIAVRSETKITAEVFAAAPLLKVVGRAGVGVVQQRQLGDAALRPARQPLQQRREVPRHALDGGGLPQVDPVGERARQPRGYLYGSCL